MSNSNQSIQFPFQRQGKWLIDGIVNGVKVERAQSELIVGESWVDNKKESGLFALGRMALSPTPSQLHQ